MDKYLQWVFVQLKMTAIMEKIPLAIVTGGSLGIGRSICTRLQSKNYKVINADIRPPKEGPAGNYHYINCDIKLPDQVQELSNLIQMEGQPEVLVLNAGLGVHEKLREGDPEKWAEVINVNICGTLRVIRAVLPFMNRGHVIFLSSVSSSRPHPYGGVYAATKSALDTIAETLRQEELPEIGVTVISPGVVNTPFFNNMLSGSHTVESIGWGSIESEEVADAVIYVLSQKKGTVINNITLRPAAQQL